MTEYAIMGLIGLGLMALTSLISYHILRSLWAALPRLISRHNVLLLLMSLPVFVAHITCIWLYAAVIYGVSAWTEWGTLTGEAVTGAAPGFLLCLYYSAMVYSTVGFGDVIPTKGLEMLAGIEALNGLVLIGWTVSFTYLSMEKFWNRTPG